MVQQYGLEQTLVVRKSALNAKAIKWSHKNTGARFYEVMWNDKFMQSLVWSEDVLACLPEEARANQTKAPEQ